MSEQKHSKPTPPSQALGEGGDQEARDEAEEAVRPRTQEDEENKNSASDNAERNSSKQSTQAATSDESDE
ncbi:hypothetical protein ACWDBO_52135 [Streptomyces mirabilis]|uniref:hypothetical protein n=1 Tax=Streptomyces TaxID=1883 RepID=UPI0029A896D0|nr:hypothetical protein [Streptomyces sp. AK02-04a]MDX3762376.1 hypothetical protein [Streptomyces sp. AK02-04a]